MVRSGQGHATCRDARTESELDRPALHVAGPPRRRQPGCQCAPRDSGSAQSHPSGSPARRSSPRLDRDAPSGRGLDPTAHRDRAEGCCGAPASRWDGSVPSQSRAVRAPRAGSKRSFARRFGQPRCMRQRLDFNARWPISAALTRHTAACLSRVSCVYCGSSRDLAAWLQKIYVEAGLEVSK